MRRGKAMKRAAPTITTAEIALHRFYSKAVRQNHNRPSFVEAIASAPSRFAVETMLDDFHRFCHSASAKTKGQVEETARVRLCVLRGVLP